MSEQVQKIMFGSINDNDESLKGKGGSGVFGLNQEALITKFEYNPNAGKDGAAADAVDIFVDVQGREYRRRIYDVTMVYDSKGNQLLNENDPEYIKNYNSTMKQNMGLIVHCIKALGVTQQQLDNALSTPATNFVDWVKIVLSLLPSDFAKRPVDVFLEYQWTISDGADRTYLELPKNMKGGYFICQTMKPVGSWNAVNTWEEVDSDGKLKTCTGLSYVDNAGNKHMFKRNQNYMESNKAIQQIDGQENLAQSALNNVVTANNQNPQKSTWGGQ